MIKTSRGGNGLFGLYVQITAHHEGRSGQERKAGTEAETVKDCCYWLTQDGLRLLSKRQPHTNHLPWDGATVGWALPRLS